MTRPSSQDYQVAPPRTKINLSDKLEKRLRLYALGAGAGSLGLLALAPPARAQIVFTPLNVTLKNGTVPIDLNHDGIVDFSIADKDLTTMCCFYTQVLRVNGNGNVGASVVGGRGSAGALQAGRVIGPGDPFENVQSVSAPMATAFNDSNSFLFVYGQFANTVNRFLGLKFQFSGETHYGWVQFTFVQAGFHGSIPFVTARLVGYAYDAVPDQPLRAGQRDSSDVDARLNSPGSHLTPHAAPALQPPSLGLLAFGSAGLSAWRRNDALEP